MFFDGSDFDIAFTYIDPRDTIINKKESLEPKIVNSEEGFLKGNMFKNEYVPYKKYFPKKIKVKDEQQMLLYKAMEYSFAFNDLNLYLDLNPKDKYVLELFNMYVKEYNKLKEEYNKKYGPLMLNQLEEKEYKWIDNPWPWDDFGGSMYV